VKETSDQALRNAGGFETEAYQNQRESQRSSAYIDVEHQTLRICILSFAETNSKVPNEQHAEPIRKSTESRVKKSWENINYIARTGLEAIFTESAIRALIREDESLRDAEFLIAQHGRTVDADSMTNEILTSTSRVLALCVYVDLPLSFLHSLMRRGITGLYLPLSQVDCPELNYATC
jgi:hypothetical protein